MANAKLDVDIASFVTDINTAKGVLKGLNAEMKAADAEFKATGNAEQQLTAKTNALNSQIRMQKSIVDNAKNALKAMDDEGINPADASYQRLYATMMNATAGMNEAQAELNALGSSAKEAASGADQLTNSVNGISKKISLDQVRSGIDSITSGLENAARKAVQLGEAIWNNVMDSARLADDILTQATMLDMTPERYQQYKGVFDTIGEITVTEWAAAKRKVQKAMNDPSQDQMDVLSLLGIGTQMTGKNGEVEKIARSWEDMFWEAATALKGKVEAGEITQDMADTWGEALFGKKYSSMKSLINLGREGFEQALETVNTASDEALEKDAALNDQVIKLKESFEALKMEVTSALAPALTDAAKALDSMLSTVLDYLKTEDGQKLLADLGTAISGLFDDLGKIDPEQVVSGITGVLESVTGAVQWLVDNKEGVFEALKWIVFGWAGLNVAGGILDIVKVVGGLADLTGISAAGTAAGSAWGAAFAQAVAAAAPWIIGLYTLLNPAGTAGDDLDVTFANGKVTTAGWEFWNNNLDAWNARLTKVGNRYGDLGTLITAEIALNIIGNTTIDDEEVFRQLEEQLSLKPLDVPFEPVVEEDAAANLAEQVGVVEVPAVLVFTGNARGLFTGGAGGGGAGAYGYLAEHANGLPFVPYDGYLAQLHRGERVMTASENKSYTYNSNNYFGNVNLNNGQDIEALCDSIDRHNRRQRSGYGS